MTTRTRRNAALGLILLPLLALLLSFQSMKSDLDLVEQAVERQDYERASRLIRLQLVRNPDVAVAEYLRAARVARRAEELDNAANLLAEAERRCTDDKELSFERLLLAAQRGHAVRIHPLLNDILQRRDGETELALEALGRGYLRAFRLNEARDCFKELLRLQPDSLTGLLGYSQVMREMTPDPWGIHPFQEPIRQLERAVAVAPWHFTARLWLADAMNPKPHWWTPPKEMPVPPEANDLVRHLQVADRLKPGNPDVRTRLSAGLVMLGETERAEQMLHKVITDYPTHSPALWALAQSAQGAGDDAREALWCQKVLVADPFHRQALYRTAMRPPIRFPRTPETVAYLQRLAKVTQAVERIESLKLKMVTRLGDDQPSNPELRYEVGIAALQLGWRDEARLWFGRTLLENPNHRQALSALRQHFGPSAADEYLLE